MHRLPDNAKNSPHIWPISDTNVVGCKFKIEVEKDRHGLYRVGLGNGVVHHFTSKRDVKSFEGRFTKFFSRKLYEANQLYAELYKEQRALWFVGRKTSDFKFVEKSLDLMKRNSTMENGRYYAFKDISYICGVLMDMVLEMHRDYKLRSITEKVYEMEGYRRRIMDLNKAVITYSMEDASDYRIDIKERWCAALSVA